MRSLALALGVAAAACHTSDAPPKAKPGSASASGSAAAAQAATPDAHPLPIDAAAKLKSFGPQQGRTIYVPATSGDVEHWIAFVGGDTATSAWIVTPGDPKQQFVAIGGWPTALRVDGVYLEAGDHGLGASTHPHEAWLTVTSTAGMGQPAGLHTVIDVEMEGVGLANSISTLDEGVVALAGVTDPADIAKKLDALAAERKLTFDLASEDTNTKLAALFADPKASDDALAPLIPDDGVVIATTWQKLFVQSQTRAKTSADLRPVLGRGEGTWNCSYTTCTGLDDEVAVLGVERGKLVLRAILVAPKAPDAPPGARHPIAASASTTATQRTLHEQGDLGATVIAEAPLGTFGPTATLGVVRDGDEGRLIAREGAFVRDGNAHLDGATTAAQIRFADVDGDGQTDVAIATTGDDGVTRFWFDTIGPYVHDIPSGLAALGAADVDDALARALALPSRPVTREQACKLLRSIKSKRSLARLGPHARVIAFAEPNEPEVGGDEITDAKESVHAIKDAVTFSCDLICDPVRPSCELPAMGPDTEYFQFAWNGDALELTVAMIYVGG